MRSNLILLTVLGTSALVCLGGPAKADPFADTGQTVYGDAPIGHFQPRGPRFSPTSPADEIEQGRESAFDSKERKLEKQLDKKLNICRC